MNKNHFQPINYGVNLSRNKFACEVFKNFTQQYGHIKNYSVDELLMHPQEGIQFCHRIRNSYNTDMPDHLILWAALHRRKHPEIEQENIT